MSCYYGAKVTISTKVKTLYKYAPPTLIAVDNLE